MTQQQPYFSLSGGLDQESAAIAVPPGRAIAVMNHECVSKGYQRTQGFERFDGQPSPSDAVFFVGEFDTGSVEFGVGDEIEGATSGATGRIIDVVVEDGSFDDGDAVGKFVIDLPDSGQFTVGEDLLVSSVPVAEVTQIPAQGSKQDSAAALQWHIAAVENRRAEIAKPNGSGPVRGVIWYEGQLFVWRDNGGGTIGKMHKSSATGWQTVDLGSIVSFTNGGPYEVMPGDEITGTISGATATVRYIALDAATAWEDGIATGKFVLDDVVGTFVEETIDVGINAFVANIAGAPAITSFPPGGRYELLTQNFYGAVGTERIYGANGVGPAFEFDGDNLVTIDTGMPDDRPFLITAHKKHLFLGFPKGSLQFSALGEPRSFRALLGAAEIGMGHELTNLCPNTAATLLVTTDSSVAALTGNDSSDFLLETISDEAGARRHTAERIGNVIYMDERGIRSLSATQSYGNFKLGTFTTLIQATLEAKRKLGVKPCGSATVKSKDQYVLFFDDGSGITLYMGRKNPEAMLFQYPFVVTAGPFVAEVEGKERVFVGADDGFVYELNVGTSFDGEEIEAYIQLPFGHQGGPRILKRYHKAIIEMVCGPDAAISVVAQFDYAGGYQPYAHGDVFGLKGSGGIWGISNWAEFYWSAPTVAKAEAYLQGAGENMSLIVFSKSKTMDEYVMQGVTICFSLRGQKR